MEVEDGSSLPSEASSWTSYFCDSFKPACFEATWDIELQNLPLHAAVLSGDTAAAQALLDSRVFPVGEHIDLVNKHTDGAPIHAAIRKGDLAMLEILLDYGAFVHRRAPDEYGELSIPALTIAVRLGNADIVQALLDADADPVVTDRQTIDIAAEMGHTRVVEVLLRWSRSRDVPLDKNSALETAAREWQPETTWALLNDGIENNDAVNGALLSAVNPNAWGLNSVLPFYLRFDSAYRERQSAVMKMLLDAGADPNNQRRFMAGATMASTTGTAVGSDGQWSHPSTTPLHAASSAAGSADIIELLVENGANVDLEDDFGQTALYYGTLSNDIAVVRTLLEWGADVPGETPLHAAAHSEFEANITIMEKLLDLGADINAQKVNGWTPLMHAVDSNVEIKCQYLLARGADAELTTADKETALQRAIFHGRNASVVGALVDYGAKTVTADQSTALHWAVESPNQSAVVRCLLDHGLSPNVRDGFGATPLINMMKMRGLHAEWEIKEEVIRLLVDRGADVNAVDYLGLTVKDWAESVGYSGFCWDLVWQPMNGMFSPDWLGLGPEFD
ncbi:predicted protein [Uncinocarpus reesii 1704]|uniref:Uncharacterized protein n=1 Tax=Uncinocarpus reesii (strain UAMH 1704) TaxID=336963 RepID=C4JPQ4_UNCRE|nr:uncharacterized protein UREG_04547 [Uncinocarpus reesii 1704]EEP79701.1 predicted protein [Uncinocarpus reesii 1704]